MKRGKTCRILLSTVLALALLAAGPAAVFAEDRLEPAPEVTLPEAEEETDSTGTSSVYLPYPYTFADRSEDIPDEMQYNVPRLTNGELERIRKMMADMEAGRELNLNDKECLDQTEDVQVGVYPLDPADFDGETFFVILPNYRMTDSMLYSLICAFDRLGIPFDPDSLNERNCFRSDLHTETNRGLSYEEHKRMRTIRYRIHRGKISRDRIPEGTYCRCVTLAGYSSYVYGSDYYRYCIYPYRSMTDEELAAFAFAMEGVWDMDPDEVEKQAIRYVRSLVKAPLSLIEKDEQMFRKRNGGRIYEKQFSFLYADEVTGVETSPEGKPLWITVWMTQEGDGGELELTEVCVYYNTENEPDNWPERSGDEWAETAKQWAAENLFIPAEEVTADWKLMWDNPSYPFAEMAAETKDMKVVLVLNKWDASARTCSVNPKK